MNRLYRAVVSLPTALAGRDGALQERIVFFEARGDHPGDKLEMLLRSVWLEDTANWLNDGIIYNVEIESELLGNAVGDASTGDLRLLEVGFGPGGTGGGDIHYADAADIDLFVTPLNAARLREAMDVVEELQTPRESVRNPIRQPNPHGFQPGARVQRGRHARPIFGWPGDGE